MVVLILQSFCFSGAIPAGQFSNILKLHTGCLDLSDGTRAIAQILQCFDLHRPAYGHRFKHFSQYSRTFHPILASWSPPEWIAILFMLQTCLSLMTLLQDVETNSSDLAGIQRLCDMMSLETFPFGTGRYWHCTV
jgi:hypothetical protein